MAFEVGIVALTMVKADRAREFEDWVRTVVVPAVSKQPSFAGRWRLDAQAAGRTRSPTPSSSTDPTSTSSIPLLRSSRSSANSKHRSRSLGSSQCWRRNRQCLSSHRRSLKADRRSAGFARTVPAFARTATAIVVKPVRDRPVRARHPTQIRSAASCSHFRYRATDAAPPLGLYESPPGNIDGLATG